MFLTPFFMRQNLSQGLELINSGRLADQGTPVIHLTLLAPDCNYKPVLPCLALYKDFGNLTSVLLVMQQSLYQLCHPSSLWSYVLKWTLVAILRFTTIESRTQEIPVSSGLAQFLLLLLPPIRLINVLH